MPPKKPASLRKEGAESTALSQLHVLRANVAAISWTSVMPRLPPNRAQSGPTDFEWRRRTSEGMD
jgi:hypothetical protein